MTNVGYPLYREIRDFAPADWSSSELVVALMVADDANDDTRLSWIPLQLLCARTRLAASSVRAALAKLGGRGYEFRVIHGYGADGRPVFATKSHAVDYLVPEIIKGARIPAPIPVDNQPQRRQDPSGFTDSKALGIEPKALGIGPKALGSQRPSPQSPHISSTEESSAVTGPVESAPATPDQNHHHHQPWPGGMHWVSPIEQAARQAAESRTIRTRGNP